MKMVDPKTIIATIKEPVIDMVRVLYVNIELRAYWKKFT